MHQTHNIEEKHNLSTRRIHITSTPRSTFPPPRESVQERGILRAFPMGLLGGPFISKNILRVIKAVDMLADTPNTPTCSANMNTRKFSKTMRPDPRLCVVHLGRTHHKLAPKSAKRSARTHCLLFHRFFLQWRGPGRKLVQLTLEQNK